MINPEYPQKILNYVKEQHHLLFREPKGNLKHKFIVPGSVYAFQLWDWDSWLTDVAISEVVTDPKEKTELFEYQKGCIYNFLDAMNRKTGFVPIEIGVESTLPKDAGDGSTNTSKPCLIQHTLAIAEYQNSFEWVKPLVYDFELYISYYENYCKHESGLYFFIDDMCIGVDNDPCTFYRPRKSSASIFLNCLMYKEFLALSELFLKVGETEKSEVYIKKANELKNAVNEYCYDERNGFYYSVDINLLPINKDYWLHSGAPRAWSTLIQRIDVWSGFLALWAGIADEKQAERVVKENYLNENTFNANYGVRTLSKCEKMYSLAKTGNPSCWLGPVWGVSNYLTYEGLKNYGYIKEANELAEKTINLFGKDICDCGEMHEYYNPDTGEGINHQGFQSWNLLAGKIVNDIMSRKY